MSRSPDHAKGAARRALRPGVSWEFERLSVPREFSRTFVTRLLVERAETGGWELHRVRIGADGVRRVELRRRIMRADPTRLAG
ncbi:hypothetical protein GCM10027425_01170 [Alteromonas gracilis]